MTERSNLNEQRGSISEARLRRQVPVKLLLLAGPIIAATISRTVMSFVDFAMVSQLGTEAQAAIMPAGLSLFTVIAFGMGLSSSVLTFVAQSYGRGRRADCSAYAWQGLYLSLGVGLAALPLWWLVPSFFALSDHAPAVQAMEVTYVRIGIPGIAPTIAAVALANFFNGVQRPAVALVAAVLANIFNIAANYALIFGHWGFEAGGIAGAAWATLLASMLQVSIMLFWLLRPAFRQGFDSGRTFRPSLVRLKALVRLGLPAGVHQFLELAAWTMFLIFLVGQFGMVHLAATNLAFKLTELAFMPAVGLGVALSSAVGKAIGQRRPDLARLNTRWAAIMAVSYMGVIGLVYLTMGRTLAGLLSIDPAVTDVAVVLLVFCAVFQMFDGLYIVYTHALRGAGDTRWPALVMALYLAVFLLGGGLVVATLMPQWQSYGPWAVGTAYVALAGVTFWARFIFGPWERIDLLGDQ
jgi:MATE family multidrug resistance protein